MVQTNFYPEVIQDALVDLGAAKVKTYRAEQAKFFVGFSDWMKKANVGVVTAFAQSESNGWITLTLCYYEKRDLSLADAIPTEHQILADTASALRQSFWLIDAIADKLVLSSAKVPKAVKETLDTHA